MRVKKNIALLLLCFVFNLNAQNKFAAEFSINNQNTKNINIKETSFGFDYNKTINSKFRIQNKMNYNFKTLDYAANNTSNSLINFIDLSNKLEIKYQNTDKTQFNFGLEPYLASQNNLKISNIDLLAKLNFDFSISPTKKFSIGISRNNFFGKTKVLPIFTYYYEYGKDVKLSLGFPESKLSYSNNIRNIFSIKNEFNGRLYSLENIPKSVATESTKSSFSQLTTELEYERNMDNNWFVTLKMGFDFNRDYFLLDKHYDTTLDFDIKDGYQFGLKIKYKH